jgi:putative MFS transporter
MVRSASSQNAKLLGEEEGGSGAHGISVDACLLRAGEWGAYQQHLMLTLGVLVAVLSAHMLAPIFLVPRLQLVWELSAVELGLISSLFFAGYFAGVFFWACVSDRFGRRPTILAAFTIGNAAGVACFAATSFWAFSLLRLVCGFGVAGSKNGTFLLLTEYATPRMRSRVGAYFSYFWLTGLLFLVLVAWLVRDWHWRWLVLTYVPGIAIQLVLPRIVPESPRFALVSGGIEHARSLIVRVFKTNGRTPPDPLCLHRPQPVENDERRPSACSQLFSPQVRASTLALGTCQAVCTMAYYAITFDTRVQDAAGGLYLGALLGALIELP